MKTLSRILSLVLLIVSFGGAATRSDINAIEAAEHVRFLSQKIAKDYLYLYARPKRREVKDDIREMMVELSEKFAILSASTKDSDTKDLLKYLQYNKSNIEELLSGDVTKESALQMLDYSEILLEGAESIARQHRYPFNTEEAMLMQIKKAEYLVERLGKFYMVSSLGVLSQTNQKKMQESARDFEESLKAIQEYQYPSSLEKQKKQLALFWSFGQYSLAHSYDMFIPNIVNTTGNYFEQLLTRFALYHSKSQ